MKVKFAEIQDTVVEVILDREEKDHDGDELGGRLVKRGAKEPWKFQPISRQDIPLEVMDAVTNQLRVLNGIQS